MRKETIAGSEALAAEKTLVACPSLARTLDLVRGKWKPMLLYHLSTSSPRRFGELLRLFGGHVTQHTLTQQLREMEHDNLVHRAVFAEVPPRVEYSLTDKGRSLRALMDQIYSWGEQQENQFEA